MSSRLVARPSTSTPELIIDPRPAEAISLPLFVPGLIPTHLRDLTVGVTRGTAAVVVLFLAWLAALGYFWYWFFEPAHEQSLAGLLLLGLVQAYLTTLPLPMFLGALGARRVNPRLGVPSLRVAFIVTKTPSEPWEIAEETLRAMLNQSCRFAYDVWLCDERPADTTKAWCEEHGVRISSRFGVEAYHQPTYPRRTRIKEGNVAYFYDHWGYRDYDVVAQFDVDHVPAPNYLEEVVRPFSDPRVGYVAAPSICDSNAAQSWSARGRLWAEAGFHGVVQAGSNGGFAPLCIGSHYVVRTRALKEIGGIGPGLAEDFSTSFLLSSAGWKGAFAYDAEAHGEGPPTFAAMLTQEYQWSRSLTELIIEIVAQNWRKLDWRLRLKFSYQLGFYPMLAFFSLLGLCLSPYASLAGQPLYHTNYLAYLHVIALLCVPPFLLRIRLRHLGALRPVRPKLISWEQSLYVLVRWPVVLRGVLAGVIQKVLHRQLVIKVTPKGSVRMSTMPFKLVAPYAAIVTVMAASDQFGARHRGSQGYSLLCIIVGVTYGIVSLLIPLLHVYETRRSSAVSVGDMFASIRVALLTAIIPIGLLSYAAATTVGSFHLLHAPWFV